MYDEIKFVVTEYKRFKDYHHQNFKELATFLHEINCYIKVIISVHIELWCVTENNSEKDIFIIPNYEIRDVMYREFKEPKEAVAEIIMKNADKIRLAMKG